MKLIFVFVTLLSLHQRPVNACGLECIFSMIKDYLQAFGDMQKDIDFVKETDINLLSNITKLETQVINNTVNINSSAVSCVFAAIEFRFFLKQFTISG